jgi:hypothetical protein
MYNLNKNKKCITRFKSHTDINNYNKFLLELDKKQKIENWNHCNDGKINPDNDITKKQNIDETLKNITRDFIVNNLDNSNVTGLTRSLESSEKCIDPNLYQPNPIVQEYRNTFFQKVETNNIPNNIPNIITNDITNDINPDISNNELNNLEITNYINFPIISPKKNLSSNIKITKIDNNSKSGKIVIIFDD